MIGAHMAINVQEPHEMSAPIDAHARKLCAKLLGAMARGQTGEPAPQRFHFRRAVEPKQPAERSWIPLLEMFGPLYPEQRHKHERALFDSRHLPGGARRPPAVESRRLEDRDPVERNARDARFGCKECPDRWFARYRIVGLGR